MDVLIGIQTLNSTWKVTRYEKENILQYYKIVLQILDSVYGLIYTVKNLYNLWYMCHHANIDFLFAGVLIIRVIKDDITKLFLKVNVVILL